MYYATDCLGIAQYLSRLGLLLGGTDSLTAAKSAWLDDPAWQPLRRYIEDSMVIRDPFELFVAHDLVLDGLLYPLVYRTIVGDRISAQGGATIAILTQFMTEWHDETRKWVDAVVLAAAAESAANRAVLTEWFASWRERAIAALTPVAEIALGGAAGEAVAAGVTALNTRAAKARLTD
jgi:phenol hydroxylase P1 protein